MSLINLPRSLDLRRFLLATKMLEQKRGSDEEKSVTSRGAFGSSCSKKNSQVNAPPKIGRGEGTMLALPNPNAEDLSRSLVVFDLGNIGSENLVYFALDFGPAVFLFAD